MEVLFNFLTWVSSFSHIDEESGSKMDIHNLATVMTPNILYLTEPNKTGGPVIDTNVNDSFLAIEAVHELIYHNEAMCEVRPAPPLPLPKTSPTDSIRPDPRRSLPDPQRFLPLLRLSRHHNKGNPQTLRRPRPRPNHQQPLPDAPAQLDLRGPGPRRSARHAPQ